MNDREKLLSTLANPAASLDARIAAGAELARIGDHRATTVDRVLIPGGPFLYSRRSPSEDDEEGAGDGESPGDDGEEGESEPRAPRSGGPMHRVELSTFHIDRYPVTVAAFAEFIAAGGYRDERYWSDEGWEWRTSEGIEKPRFWGEAEWAPYLVHNHPVVGVSVHEAEAYASFREVRLPTEAEWEKACRGTDGRLYPWGDAWIDDACGIRDVGPRHTVAIGCYPAGVSPYGVYDMVGSVWQWCADAADADAAVDDEDPFVDPDGYEETSERVTRGGGWNNLRWSLSCSSRNGFPPTARFSNLGFRCATS
jgi:gamma-glutamyl hercynylcysteine S-oxide synthase